MTSRLLAFIVPAVLAAGAGTAIAANGDSAAVRAPAAPAAEIPINVGGDSLPGGRAEGTVKIDGVPGESTVRAGEVDVKSFAFGGKNVPGTSGGGGAGKVQFNDVRFAKLYDAASPKLMLRMASGQHIPSVTFTFQRPGATTPFLTYKLTDVIVAGYEQGGDQQRPLLEHVELNFAKVQVSYVPLNGGAPVTAGWDVKLNASV